MNDIETIFLCEGCQIAEEMARKLADFLSTARRTIDICIYSFSLCPETAAIVVAALRERVAAGVQVRIAYDAGTQQGSVLAEPDCEVPTSRFVPTLGFPSKPIEAYRALMHNKYVVIDQGTPDARVWTGSTNFTDDSWNLQENNIIVLRSEELAAYYAHDFEELWVDGNIASSGVMDTGEVLVRHGGEPADVVVHFAPLEGELINDGIAERISRTTRRITIAAVVITSSAILNALLDRVKAGVPMEGVYDWAQMEGVKYQWQGVPQNRWKPGAFERIVGYGRLVGKQSTPYTPTSKHDFMHNKIMVLDDTVITGSYNFSRHAQGNAENVLMITSPALARTYRNYIGGIMEKYAPARTLPGG